VTRCRILTLSLLILFLNSCAPKPPQELTPTEAHKKLVDLCKNEYNLDVTTKAFENTLWIYLPMDHSFLSLTTSEKGPIKSSDPDKKQKINFLDGQFSDGAFQMRYDIGLSETYTDDRGIGTRVSEEYTVKQRFLFSAITRAYAEVEKKPYSDQYAEKVPGDTTFMGERKNTTHKKLVHSYVKTANVPDFFVIIIADIKLGIETRTYLYLQDLRRASIDQGFGEEYIKRVIVDQPMGHQIIIGDKKGSHLEAYDLSWPEFLSKQMTYRINFKYQRSAFPPSNDTRLELLTIAADTVAAYDFEDFASIQLHDLDNGTTFSTAREDLTSYRSESSEGRLIHIRFE